MLLSTVSQYKEVEKKIDIYMSVAFSFIFHKHTHTQFSLYFESYITNANARLVHRYKKSTVDFYTSKLEKPRIWLYENYCLLQKFSCFIVSLIFVFYFLTYHSACYRRCCCCLVFLMLFIHLDVNIYFCICIQ